MADNRFMVNAILALNVRSGIYAQSPALASLHLDLLWWPVDRQTLLKCLQWRRDVSRTLIEEKKSLNKLGSSILGKGELRTGTDNLQDKLMVEAQVLLVAGKLCKRTLTSQD